MFDCSLPLVVARDPGDELPGSCVIEGNTSEPFEDGSIAEQILATLQELARCLVLDGDHR
jgi:hypothetical protein